MCFEKDVSLPQLIRWRVASIDRIKVIEALESGIEVDTPSGKVSMDPKTQHCVMNMYICEVKGRKFEILKSQEKVPPSDTQGVCDLIRNPDTNTQYESKL